MVVEYFNSILFLESVPANKRHTHVVPQGNPLILIPFIVCIEKNQKHISTKNLTINQAKWRTGYRPLEIHCNYQQILPEDGTGQQ